MLPFYQTQPLILTQRDGYVARVQLRRAEAINELIKRKTTTFSSNEAHCWYKLLHFVHWMSTFTQPGEDDLFTFCAVSILGALQWKDSWFWGQRHVTQVRFNFFFLTNESLSSAYPPLMSCMWSIFPAKHKLYCQHLCDHDSPCEANVFICSHLHGSTGSVLKQPKSHMWLLDKHVQVTQRDMNRTAFMSAV